MTKAELIKALKYIEDDVEILARDTENLKTYEIIGVKPVRTLETAWIVIKQKD